MLNVHLSQLIEKELGYQPTNDQKELIVRLGLFLTSENSNTIFLLRGYAGTGKTTVIAALVKVLKSLKQVVVLLAPTGRAAKVLSQYSQTNATTIHKKIYRQKSGSDYDTGFVVDYNLHRNALFIVDEASMIGDQSVNNSLFGSGNLLADLVEYVKSGIGCKLILSGDVAQLPPVGLNLSPALREKDLIGYCNELIVSTLRDVVRQAANSGILFNATAIRNKLVNKDYSLPIFNMTNYADIKLISGTDFVEHLEQAYNKYGRDMVSVITRTNKQASVYNRGIRQSVLWHDSELVAGDLLMVVRNNYNQVPENKGQNFIANGDIVKLVRLHRIIDKYGFRFAEATITMPDIDVPEFETILLLDTLYSHAAGLSDTQNLELYRAVENDYIDIKNKRNRFIEIRNNKYFNALHVKFAYALTCHKAQGGQWSAVFIDQGYFTEQMLDIEYFRWLYTAVTRAKTEIYLINFKDTFFE